MKEKMTNKEFKLMQGIMKLMDKVSSHVSRKADSFGIQQGMTVVDYGCGPGRYTVEFVRLVGPEGKVYSDDFLVNHIAGSFVEMVQWWLKNGMKQSPEKLARYFLSVIIPII
jgi:tRNA A58 N-methylase Trm61